MHRCCLILLTVFTYKYLNYTFYIQLWELYKLGDKNIKVRWLL